MGRWATAIRPGKQLPFKASPSEIVRFLKKVHVEQLLSLDSELDGPCWIWRAATDPRGYGAFKWRGRTVWAHRFAHEVFIGPVPDGEDVDHRCFSRACVNPAHLAAKAPTENRRNTSRSRPRAADPAPPAEPAAADVDRELEEIPL